MYGVLYDVEKYRRGFLGDQLWITRITLSTISYPPVLITHTPVHYYLSLVRQRKMRE